jgi:hypothetical protein
MTDRATRLRGIAANKQFSKRGWVRRALVALKLPAIHDAFWPK